MAIIRPFAGYRPPPELAAKVAAPPYDVINSAEARDMAAGNDISFLHVNKPEIDLPPETDPYSSAVYERGAENLKRFIDQGILCQDDKPGFYLYRQVMGDHEQTGLVVLASVEEYEKGIIKKHEFTRPNKENDRVAHMDKVNAQVGPVFLTYHSRRDIDEFVSESAKNQALYDFTDDSGIRHVLWLLQNPEQISFLIDAFSAIPTLYVADGHHRSAAATRVAQMRRQANPNHNGEESYNYFLSVLFPHDQMKILDYNRVVRDLKGRIPEAFLDELQQVFSISVLPQAEKPTENHVFSLYLDGTWYRLETKPHLIQESDPVKRLDVSILQELVLSPMLGIEDPRTDDRVDFVGGIRGTAELTKLVNSGQYAAAFACFPTSIDNLMAIADADQVMPPKSTWFEPKLKSGLVIHKLD